MITSDNCMYPANENFLSRHKKEEITRQHAKALWLTGLSGSGKTTIAFHLEQKLHNEGYLTKFFDGDIVRSTFNKDLGFSIEDRMKNIQRVAEINKEFIDNGIIVINCFISPTVSMRLMAREIIGDNDFIEVFVSCPLHICEQRDTKGLYAKTRKGQINNFTGINSVYEVPENPKLIIDTENLSINDSVNSLYNFILPTIKYDL